MADLKRSVLVTAVLAVVASAKVLWSSSPASSADIIRTAYPLGNGILGAMPFGPAGAEKVVLNIDSLWSGGPFETDSYTGGNPNSSVSGYLPGIRSWIFENGTGNVTELLGSNDNYGSYRVLGNFSVELDGVLPEKSSYRRELDLATAIHTTSFVANDRAFNTSVYCSFVDQVCVYEISSDGELPIIHITLENQKAGQETVNQVCGDGFVRLTGVTQLGPPTGMQYDAIARILGDASSECLNGTLKIDPQVARTMTFVIGAGTNFDPRKGTTEYGYSFRGEDPAEKVEVTVADALTKSAKELRDAHIEDYKALFDRFSLDLPDTKDSNDLEIAEMIGTYHSSDETGDPYLEALLFDYSRYLFISASRENSLPPNLQGRWSEDLTAAWSGDYHANINLQMNHWNADQTGLGDLQVALWNYIEHNWVPRGSETARLLYDAPGFVVHDEMNIFGHTGMKSDAQWANYPIAAAWMMQHVWDNFDYSRDLEWFSVQGYPLLKAVAQFWLSQLFEDQYNKDGTLVVTACNSAEHGPTTFGCAHYQQLVHQVLQSVLTGSRLLSGTTDNDFVQNVTLTLARLDKGFHVGSWGQIKEWKLPDTYGYEFENDTHRHLSELVGWYPGCSISSLQGGYANKTVQDAITTKLWSRGNGNAADANAGWAKVWRAACYARLNDSERAHFELRYAIEQNFAPNGFSMYSGRDAPFQIDANYGLGGAILSMLIVDLPEHDVSDQKASKFVVLGPAIPSSWAGGSVKGMRLRGGGVVDFAWDTTGLVNFAQASDEVSSRIIFVDRSGKEVLHQGVRHRGEMDVMKDRIAGK